MAKHGTTEPAAPAYEIEDLLHTVLAPAHFYGIEAAVDEAITKTYADVAGS